MDFQTLLNVAKNNTLHKKEPVKCLQTKFKRQTKEQKDKARVLSDGVARFLARRTEEERAKKLEADKKRAQLLEMRARDPKLAKQQERMSRHAKSTNKSVMQDVDTTNTAITSAGPSQPDEDDYGFCSETATALYDKLMQKLYKQDTPKTEERRTPVKKPLPKVEKTPEKVAIKPKKEPEVKPKPKRAAPIDFTELLKIAEKKQFEPIVIEPKVKKTEPEQLLTKKQRDEIERARREREAAKIAKPVVPAKKPVKKIVKKSESDTERLKRERDEALRALQEKEAAFKAIQEKERLIRERDEALKKLREIEEREKSLKKPKIETGKQFPAKHVRRPDPGKSGREFPPRDVARLKPKSLPKKRKIIDSDEEYDSDLDDFIVDAPDPNLRGEDVSRIISDIFKYDKKKYSQIDDDECMESNWAQISKEDFISTRIGLMEDLEDIKAEKMALAKKKRKI